MEMDGIDERYADVTPSMRHDVLLGDIDGSWRALPSRCVCEQDWSTPRTRLYSGAGQDGQVRWSGARCDVIDKPPPSHSNYCGNHGEWIAEACRCRPGHYGDRCQNRCKEPPTLSVCGILSNLTFQRPQLLPDAELKVVRGVTQRCIELVHPLCMDAALVARPCRVTPLRIAYFVHVDSASAPFLAYLREYLEAIYDYTNLYALHVDASLSDDEYTDIVDEVSLINDELFERYHPYRVYKERRPPPSYVSEIRGDVVYPHAPIVVMRARHRVVYGGRSMVDAFVDGARELLAQTQGEPVDGDPDGHFDWLIPLNARADLPLVSQAHLKKALGTRVGFTTLHAVPATTAGASKEAATYSQRETAISEYRRAFVEIFDVGGVDMSVAARQQRCSAPPHDDSRQPLSCVAHVEQLSDIEWFDEAWFVPMHQPISEGGVAESFDSELGAHGVRPRCARDVQYSYDAVLHYEFVLYMLSESTERERLLDHLSVTKNVAAKFFSTMLANSRLRSRWLNDLRFRRTLLNAPPPCVSSDPSVLKEAQQSVDKSIGRMEAASSAGFWFARTNHLVSVEGGAVDRRATSAPSVSSNLLSLLLKNVIGHLK